MLKNEATKYVVHITLLLETAMFVEPQFEY